MLEPARIFQVLHVCCMCSSRLVYPVRWDATTCEGITSLILRCPDCEFRRGVLADADEVEAFEDALCAGTDQLLHTLDAVCSGDFGGVL